MILFVINVGGYANIDTKIENIMTSEDAKISMFNLGIIVKQWHRGDIMYTDVTHKK